MQQYRDERSGRAGRKQRRGLVGPDLAGDDNTKTALCAGAAGSLVALQVFYAIPVLGIPQRLPGATPHNNQSVICIGATAAIRNKPFLVANAGC